MSSGSLPGRSGSSKVIRDKDGLELQPISRESNEETGGGWLSTVAVMCFILPFFFFLSLLPTTRKIMKRKHPTVSIGQTHAQKQNDKKVV